MTQLTQDAPRSPSPAHRSEPSAAPRWWAREYRPTLVLLTAAVVAWLIALPSVGGDAVSAWGLLASASPALAVAVLLSAAAAVSAIRAGSAGLTLSAAVVLGAVLRLSIAIGTSSAFYPWTYKHIAVSQYIGSTGRVDSSVDIYNNWPGLFAATAWMSKITGVSAFGIAHWFTPVVHIGLIFGVYAFARQWGGTPLVAATAAALYEGVDFLGQDYYSPQAVSVVLTLPFLALLGTVLRGRRPVGAHRYALVAAYLFTAVLVTHQLTPFWMLGVLIAFTVFRRCRVYWLAGYAVLATGAYVLAHYDSVRDFGFVSGDVTSNVRAKHVGVPITAVRLSWDASDAVYGLAFVVALVLSVVSWRRGNRTWAMWLMAFAPIALLAVQSYGGEAVFRVLLFALPALVFVTAGYLVPFVRRSRAAAWVTGVVVAALVLDSAQTTFVTWPSYRVTAQETALVSEIQNDAPPNAYIAPLSDGAVNQLTADYARRYKLDHNYGASVEGTATLPSDFSTPQEYQQFADVLIAARRPGRPYFIVLSSRLGAYGWQYGFMKRDAMANLRQAMSADPRWRAVAQNGDAVAFELVSTA